MAAFKYDKLIGWFNENQIKGYNYIRNEVKRTVGTIPCPGGGNIAEEVTQSNMKLKSDVIGGKPYIDGTIHIVGNIVDAACPMDLTQQKTRELLGKKGADKLMSIIMESVLYTQKKLKVDIFGFGQVFHRQHPEYWKTVEKNWDKVFSSELTVKVHVKNDILQTGYVFKTYLEKLMKEKEDQNEGDQGE